jgi:hypothetical protein
MFAYAQHLQEFVASAHSAPSFDQKSEYQKSEDQERETGAAPQARNPLLFQLPTGASLKRDATRAP